MVKLSGFVGSLGYGARVFTEWKPNKGGEPVKGISLIDTGAAVSLINTKAGPVSAWTPESRPRRLTGVGSTSIAPVFLVTLILRDTSGAYWESRELRALGIGLDDTFGVVAMLGMDIVSQADFSLSGPLGKFTLELG